jgi:glyoxylase-like metal-dependent hydrolase (beta-lactamase superfamily II)
MEIIPGFYRLPGIRGVNAYIWHPRPEERDDGEPILFDCGWPWSGRGLAAGLGALSCRPEEVCTIAITHDDVDHVGRLAMLQAVSGAEVIAHTLEAARLARDRWREPPDLPGPLNLVAAVADRLYALLPRHPVWVSQPVEDGDELPGGWIAVHTPGHTPGHAAYFHPLHRVLIAGDALRHSGGGRLHFPMHLYTEDPVANVRSIRKLAELEPEVICFGHGPVLRDAAGALRKFAQSL